jgi:hypothetical protein
LPKQARWFIIEGMNKAKERNYMDNFFYGMGTVGQLFPRLPEEPPGTSPWQGVGDAFAAAGDSLRWAMKEIDKELKVDGNQQE